MMKISTTDTIPGLTITEYKGLIFDRVVSGVGFATEFFASFTDVFGGRSGKMESQMDSLYGNLIDAMSRKASRLGADAIIGLRIDIDEISGKGTFMLMISGTGTAVITSAATSSGSDASAPTHSAPTTWTCISCNAQNETRHGFCAQCGTKRSQPWQCSECGTANAPSVKHCPSCGKQRGEEDEIKPSLLHDRHDPEKIRTDISQMEKVKDMKTYLDGVFATDTAPDILFVLEEMDKLVKFERMYGGSTDGAQSFINAFLDQGMTAQVVDKSQTDMVCPVCSEVQNSSYRMCHKCKTVLRPSDAIVW